MQIFRPYKEHEKSARYLDDARLNKQVLECYQIIRTCLTRQNLMNGKDGWFNHPITQHVWNEGKPYIPDLYNFMMICNKEWIRRGRNRSIEFTNQMDEIRVIIHENKKLFSWKKLPMFFAYQDTRTIRNVPQLYKNLLKEKWLNDKRIVKCSIK